MPPPGPERDALIATLIMGWRRGPEICHGKQCFIDSGPLHHWPELLGFSTDPHAATDVRHQMRELGWRVQVTLFEDGKVLAQFWSEDESFEAFTDDEAAAVTEAAILAMWAKLEV